MWECDNSALSFESVMWRQVLKKARWLEAFGKWLGDRDIRQKNPPRTTHISGSGRA
jgi:hypothetical protein